MNQEIVLPLDKMTIAEKMDVLDLIMDDLSRNSNQVAEIEWHGEILKKRAENLIEGKDKFISLDEAERSIRERIGNL